MNIILMAAVTADGKIAKHSDQLANWTSSADKKIFAQVTKDSGAIIMGRVTYETIGRPLPSRLNIIMTSTPQNFESIPDSLEYTNKSPQEIIETLEGKNFESVVICGGAKIYSKFLQENLINEIYLTIEPKIFGSGINLFEKIDVDINLELKSFEKLGVNSLLIKYSVS